MRIQELKAKNYLFQRKHLVWALTVSLLVSSFFIVGCVRLWVVPQAEGRVIDARGVPIGDASVSQVTADAVAKIKTGADGRFIFSGKHRWQIAMGDTLCAGCSYEIEAAGYQNITTNGMRPHWATQTAVKDKLGDIILVPK